MSDMINFGIDLGTTNSLIARFNRGTVEVFKNPKGFKEALPSVVAFRNDRIIVGDSARSYAERDPKSVASRFKRKMGTTEKIKIRSIKTSRTPIELSAEVLKELKTFIHTGETPEAAVITIPASFDTVQSNATKQAGSQAGFKQVVLLQEPIAASLAYANKERGIDLKNSQWLVYDLGGGTFDAALIRIVDGELKVVDHQGDNYLGGTDFDAAIVEKIVVPQLNKLGRFSDLITGLKSEAGRHNKVWYSLLNLVEEAKIELSTQPSTVVDLGRIGGFADDDGRTIDGEISVTRSEFENLIKDTIDRTATMLKEILTRNKLRPSDLQFVLMVGGSTYIPFVRERIGELLGIPVNTSIDPTNAIAVGAAYFASAKEAAADVGEREAAPGGMLKVRTAYNRASQETEEIFSARIDGDTANLYFRITREDGAFDSGLKRLNRRIVEELPLRSDAFNIFYFRVFTKENNQVLTDLDTIQIAQGRYSVAGQILPDEICLVKDDPARQDTRLETIFTKNQLLPARKKFSAEVRDTVLKNSDDNVKILVVEGSSEHHSTTNKPIGLLIISGRQLQRDLLKGTSIDLSFEMSGSRDLKVSASLEGTGQEFSDVFDPQQRDVPAALLCAEAALVQSMFMAEMAEAEANHRHEVVGELRKLERDLASLVTESQLLSVDDVTEDKFKLQDKKRMLSQRVHQITAGKKLEVARDEYRAVKREVSELVRTMGNGDDQQVLNEILAQDYAVGIANNLEKVRSVIVALENLQFRILDRMPDFLIGVFENLTKRRNSMVDSRKAQALIDAGQRHIHEEAWDNLREVDRELWRLLPQQEQRADEFKSFTGIV
jgi:molecular chaperone DnaK